MFTSVVVIWSRRKASCSLTLARFTVAVSRFPESRFSASSKVNSIMTLAPSQRQHESTFLSFALARTLDASSKLVSYSPSWSCLVLRKRRASRVFLISGIFPFRLFLLLSRRISTSLNLEYRSCSVFSASSCVWRLFSRKTSTLSMNSAVGIPAVGGSTTTSVSASVSLILSTTPASRNAGAGAAGGVGGRSAGDAALPEPLAPTAQTRSASAKTREMGKRVG
mmetsp:Transcript_44440/g.105997  ORF Transcript_44440/g.105997 Transcript_44440/m.105997 type:complete len:223 (-) Transcript_44440:127-795(-)